MPADLRRDRWEAGWWPGWTKCRLRVRTVEPEAWPPPAELQQQVGRAGLQQRDPPLCPCSSGPLHMDPHSISMCILVVAAAADCFLQNPLLLLLCDR